MTGTGNVSYPAGFVASKPEQEHVWYVYGRDAEHYGFRENMPDASQVELMNSGLFTQCGIDKDRAPTQQAADAQWEKCGPFRIDYWAAPVWFPIRDSDITDLPPR